MADPRTGEALRYLSVCSGIEAATQAWAPLGWTPVAFSEIEPFPCAVLAHHYPAVPNWGDMTRYQEWPDADVDVLCGGTPCQSFSVAGLRKGLADPRGSLMLTFGAIAARYRPRWLVWENVPGVLSSGGGRDFGAFLGMLGELGYGWSYRVLDAQHVRTRRFPRAVPQRRRRVFVVGYLGDWRRAAAVLFDRESLSGHPAPRRRTGKDPAGNPALGFGGGRQSGPSDVATALTAHGHRLDWEVETFVAEPLAFQTRGSNLDIGDVSGTIGSNADRASGSAPMIAFSCKDHGADASEGVAPTMRAMGHGTSHPNAGGQIAVAFDTTQITSAKNRSNPKPSDDCHPLAASANPPAVVFEPYVMMERGREGGSSLEYRQDGTANAILTPNGGRGGMGVGAIAVPWAVRRLTPRECERLQGFPDDFTQIPWRGRAASECPDGPRYKALGNSWAVNVAVWVGERIAEVDGWKD